MDKVARLPAEDRAALFGETGAGRGVANTIIEKDFWVCWTLKRLFSLQRQEAAALVFKGGTSLSKAFGAIRRFSEDIDLSFDRADLGYTGDRDPETEGISRKQANQLIKDLVDDVEHHIAEKLLPALRAVIVTQLGEPNQGQWSLECDELGRKERLASKPQTVSRSMPSLLRSCSEVTRSLGQRRQSCGPICCTDRPFLHCRLRWQSKAARTHSLTQTALASGLRGTIRVKYDCGRGRNNGATEAWHVQRAVISHKGPSAPILWRGPNAYSSW